jgi:PAS domain S-box-containing protein
MKKKHIPMLVLLVEDDPAHAAAIQRAVETSGSEFEVKVVGTLREFRRSSVDRPPNIAVMDLNLPDGRATEVLTCPPEAGQFPILVMTSYGNEQVAVEAIKAGALEYVVKSPEAFTEMPHTITHALHEWNLLQERKRAEEALEYKNIILSTQQEASIDGILVVDENGEIISFNRRFVDIWDIPSAIAESKSDEQVLQSVMNKLVSPEEFVGKLEQLHEDRNEISQDEIALKDGKTFDRYSAPMLGEGGKYYGRVWYFRDITERKWAENELRNVNRALRLTSQCNQEMVRATDESALLQAICRIAVEHGGYRLAWVGFAEQDEARSVRPVAQAGFDEGYLDTVKITWADTEHGHGPTGTAIRTGQPVLARNIPTDPAFGPWRAAAIRRGYASSIALPLLSEGHCFGALMMYAGEPDTFNPKEIELLAELANDLAYGIGTLRHRAEHKRAEEALRASQERLREIFEASPNVTSVFRMEGPDLRRTWVSPNLERLLGYTVEEALQPHWWSAHVHPEDLTRVIIDSGRILAREHIVHEYRFLRRDGNVVWIHDELRLLRGATGHPQEVVGAWTDITERKELETHLLRTQRLESVGRLASGIAHDLNNILAPMLMAPPVLREVIQDPELRNMLDLVETNAQRGSNIIKQLLTFGRGMEGERVPVQLRALVNEMSGIIRETFHKNIITRRETPPDTWLVSGDATQLHQVLMNLCVNARDAMPEGGTLTLKLENQEFDESFARMTPGARPGRYVCLSVTDTGEGIAPEHLDKIFDPFFTTKELGKGTGLGLSTVLGIVQSHDGFIQVHSQPGRGTQFKVYLPASEAAEVQPASQANQPLPQGGGELVLVVDDESSVRQVTRQLLERNGYRVIEATEGADGITQYVAHQKEVQVVVTDLAMPVMDGPAFIRVLRRLNPPVRVIAVSGYQSKSSLPADLGVPGEAHLSKPFSGAMLLQTLQRVLHPEAPPKN